jgi:antirestriction protein ArdC
MATARYDQEITDAIADEIEAAIDADAGVDLPWHGNNQLPINVSSKRAYRGANAIRLWFTARKLGYDHGAWATYKQFASINAQVSGGQQAQARVAAFIPETVDDLTKKVIKEGGFRSFPVFNVAQTNTPDAIEYGVNPDITVRATAAENEACHALVRKHVTPSGNEAHDALVAELAVAFVLAASGKGSIPRPSHARYMRAWLAVCRSEDNSSSDRFTLFIAASAASKVADKALVAPAANSNKRRKKAAA